MNPDVIALAFVVVLAMLPTLAAVAVVYSAEIARRRRLVERDAGIDPDEVG